MQNHILSAESTNPIGMIIVSAINVPALWPGALGILQAWARRRWFIDAVRP